jgi:RNA polymerase sigma-70 factor (ECF subfamily)
LTSSALTDHRQDLADALARVALGDRAALAAVYRATSAHLFGVILRIQPDRGVAEDLLQDVYISIWRAADGFDRARSQPLTWLTSIARHRAIDSLRRRRGEPQTVVLQAADDDEDAPDPLDRLASAEAGPLQLLQQAADLRQIGHCLGELSPEQRQCVALAFYQGQSHAEVAAHLAQPLGTVKSWLRRALTALKGCLGRTAAAGGA